VVNIPSQETPSLSPKLKSKIQIRKWVGIFTIVVALTVCGARAEAQQPTKVPRVGYLTNASLSAIAARTEAFRQGLRELDTWRGKTLSLSGDLLRENSIASLRSRLS
jgi:hypothetical protein